MNKKIKESIDKYLKRGISDCVARELLIYSYESELICFDDDGNPYWSGSGDSLDPDVELKFEE